MRDDEHSEWVNSYVLVTNKAPDNMSGMTNPSEMTNSSAVNSIPENIASAEKVRRADGLTKRIRVCLYLRELMKLW